MTTPKIGLALIVASALVAGPAAAPAATLVPPENSAASQYTEAIPTGGGETNAEGGQHGHPAPQKVLGETETARLDSRGAEGRAAAQLAADTAPSGAAAQPSPTGTEPNGGGAVGGQRSRQAGNAPGELQPVPAQEPAGSSGAGEVIGQATGTSSGQLGILLPMTILGAIAWAAFYLLRERRRVE